MENAVDCDKSLEGMDTELEKHKNAYSGTGRKEDEVIEGWLQAWQNVEIVARKRLAPYVALEINPDPWEQDPLNASEEHKPLNEIIADYRLKIYPLIYLFAKRLPKENPVRGQVRDTLSNGTAILQEYYKANAGYFVRPEWSEDFEIFINEGL